MFRNYEDLLEKAQNVEDRKTMAISAADDETMVHVVNEIINLDLCNVIMVGDKDKIENILKRFYQ